jgi:16S rRNA processing protein RimM
VELGRIVGAHGLRGELRVRVFGDDAQELLRQSRVSVGRGAQDAQAVEYEVASARPGRAGEARVALVGIEAREAAEELRGRIVMTDAASLAALPEGEYYAHELVGCLVEGADGRRVGVVREIWSTGAPDVLVVEDERGAEHLIPAAEELLREVDVAGRRIVIELIPGLLEPA